MNWNSPLVRLAAASIVIAIALAGLWAGGILFQDSNEATVNTSDGVAELFAATTSVETPNPEDRRVGIEIGNLAPDFEFSSFDGERLRLSDFRGRPVFLNFWATWCAPCRREMPNMMTMIELYGEEPDGLAVIGVNNSEAYEPAKRFLERVEVDLTEFAFDPTAEIVRRYGVFGMPVSYFIDANGVITGVVHGELSYKVMESSVQKAIAGYQPTAAN